MANSLRTRHSPVPVDEEPPEDVAANEPVRSVFDLGACVRNQVEVVRNDGKSMTYCLIVGILVIANICMVSLAVKAIIRAEESRMEGKTKLAGGTQMGRLCVPFNDVSAAGDGWKRLPNKEDSDCYPVGENLASTLSYVYKKALTDALTQDPAAVKTASNSDAVFLPLYVEPNTPQETVQYTNHQKPAAHVTAQQPYDASARTAETTASDETETLDDWPVKYEPYRSFCQGHVKQLTWGLQVPATGLYRVYSNIEFMFLSPSINQNETTLEPHQLPVIHQIRRYPAENYTNSEVVAERNQTISSGYRDGLTSHLVSLADLVIGDVVSVSVSHHSTLAIKSRWRWQGFFLVI